MSKPAEKPKVVDLATTRARIMDAAEELFSLRGYEAATVREITRLAGVPLGLANHHFGSKEDLFREVIQRRAIIHVQDMEDALDVVNRSANVGVEDFIRAYVGPLFERSARGDPGWKNYCRLLGLTLNSLQYKSFVSSTILLFDHTFARFADSLRSIYPASDDRGIYWCIYFLHSSVIHLLVETGMIDKQSGGLCRSSDLDEIMAEMVPFFASAFERRLGRAGK